MFKLVIECTDEPVKKVILSRSVSESLVDIYEREKNCHCLNFTARGGDGNDYYDLDRSHPAGDIRGMGFGSLVFKCSAKCAKVSDAEISSKKDTSISTNAFTMMMGNAAKKKLPNPRQTRYSIDSRL